jgi:branched-chain amino acid transport system ATP-binding protein
MPEEILEVADVCAGYGKSPVLRDVTFSLHPGETLAVVGANGAGKTTLLRAIMSEIPTTAGSVHFNGENLAGVPIHLRARRGIGYVPEGRQLFPGLNVTENLELGAVRETAARRRSRLLAMFEIFPKLQQLRHTHCGLLSGGEQQMVAIARALMPSPTLLLLDEPSTGLAPKIILDMYASLRLLLKEGLTVLVVEQNARAALRFAQNGLVFEDGRIALHGSAASLISDPRVISAYIGAQGACQWRGAPEPTTAPDTARS